jgi:antitoxin component YwqK of YwqJK toxin-antitoxin module
MTALFSIAAGAVALLGTYRLLWRHRYGRPRRDCLRLRGRVDGPPGAGRGVVCRCAPGGEVRAAPFVVRDAGGTRRSIDTSSPHLRVLGTIRIGDVVTVDAVHGAALALDSHYRESALQTTLVAVRVARGTWPQLRALDVVLAAAVIIAVITAAPWLTRRPARPPLDCPRLTEPFTNGAEEWCELGLPGALRQRHGPYREWDEGRLATSGGYRHGQREGWWESWHDNGAQSGARLFRDDHPVEELSWRRNGQPRERGSYDEIGRPNGIWESYGAEGLVVWSRGYLAGDLHGPSTTWGGGRLGSVASYRRGELHGPYSRWVSGTAAERGEYRAGEKDGLWSAWQGEVLVRQGRYLAGWREGAWRFWYATGQARAAGTYVNGRADGRWRWWHPSGGLAGEGSYSDRRKVGRWSSWDEGGALLRTGKYRDDVPVGTWVVSRHAHRSGSLLSWQERVPASHIARRPVPGIELDEAGRVHYLTR